MFISFKKQQIKSKQILYINNLSWLYVTALVDLSLTDNFFYQLRIARESLRIAGIFAKRSREEEAKEEEAKEKAEGDERSGDRRPNYSALVDKMGDLHILSEPDEEGDQDRRTRRKR